MKKPEKISLKSWYILHDSRRDQLQQKKDNIGLSTAEESLLAISLITLSELEQLILTHDEVLLGGESE